MDELPIGDEPVERFAHDLIAHHAKPAAARNLGTGPAVEKVRVGAGHAFDGARRKPTPTELAATLYNHPDWDGVLWFDVLSQRIMATDAPVEAKLTLERGELSKGDLAAMKLWLDANGFSASREAIEDALWTVVQRPERQRNPIADYLDSLEPAQDASTLTTLATAVLGCADPFANVLLTKTLVAAARRARNPGTFHKSMLVIRGEQGAGKTPFVKILAGAFYETTANGNLADRDTILQCQGKWLVEVEELSALGKADTRRALAVTSR